MSDLDTLYDRNESFDRLTQPLPCGCGNGVTDLHGSLLEQRAFVESRRKLVLRDEL